MRRPLCALLAGFLHVAGLESVQAAEILGRVTDGTGAPLPGVLVTAVASPPGGGTDDAGRIPARRATTSASGTYRLARIPAGVYLVVFRLDGFERVEQHDLAVSTRTHARVDARLHREGERREGSTSSPALLDPKTTSVGDIIGSDRLATLPVAHRAAAILEFLPGTAARWQSGHGASNVMRATGHTSVAWASGGAAGWTVDGGLLVPEPDERAFVDWRSVEEIRIERGPVDVSVQSGAVQVVTRSGTSRFAGRAQFGMTDRRLQWDNLTTALREQGATLGSRVQRSTEFAVETGGPLLPRRAWARLSASKSLSEVGIVGFYKPGCLQPDGSAVSGARDRLECLVADETIVTTGSAKLQARLSESSSWTLSWGRTSRTKPYRGASAFDRPESTTRQHSLGLARPIQVDHRWTPSDSLSLDAVYTFSNSSFVLDFQEPGLAEVQPAYDRYTLVNWRSATASRQLRRAHDAHLSATFFAPAGAGAHTAAVGAGFVLLADEQVDRTGGGAVAVFDSRTGPQRSWQARIVRDGHTNHRSPTWSAFAQDSYARGRLGVNVGVRFERQDDRALAAAIPANRVLPDLLPEVRFAGADSGVVYNDISPRGAVSWEVAGRGNTLLKVGVARYHATANATSALLQPTGQTRLVYWWSDANGDGLVQRDELDLGRGLAATPTPNYDAANPASPTTPATVDPRLRNVRNDEASAGLERQIGRRATLRVSYVVRRIGRLQRSYPTEADGSAVSSTTFTPASWTPSSCPAGARCPAVVYYEREAPLPSSTVLRNDGRDTRRHRVDLVFHKRLADGWMFDAALTWNRSVARFPRATRDYTDPTNIAQREGTEYGAPDPRWVAKLSGNVRLPGGFSAAFFLAGQAGLPYDRTVASPNRGALGSTHVSIGRFGIECYPPAWRLDARFDWRIKKGPFTLAPTLNVFNALNSNVVLARNRVQNSRSANQVVEIVPPRMIRFDVGLAW